MSNLFQILKQAVIIIQIFLIGMLWIFLYTYIGQTTAELVRKKKAKIEPPVYDLDVHMKYFSNSEYNLLRAENIILIHFWKFSIYLCNINITLSYEVFSVLLNFTKLIFCKLVISIKSSTFSKNFFI